MKIEVRRSRPEDAEDMLELYRAAGEGGGLARRRDEVEPRHIAHYLERSRDSGLGMVALSHGRVRASSGVYEDDLVMGLDLTA